MRRAAPPPRPAPEPQADREQFALVEPGEAASAAVAVLVRGVAQKAKRHPTISVTWLCGILVAMFATGVKITPEAADKYEAAMADADMSGSISRAAQRVNEFEARHRASKGWFFSCDETCKKWQAEATAARHRLESLRKTEAQKVAQVKKSVGVLSEYGVAETRERFWTSFAGGKEFAKRQSMWDALFVALGAARRDESTAAIVLRWLLQMLFNFTIGLVGALVAFAFQLWTVVFSYEPNVLTGAAFAIAALVAASAMVATYLFLMYFCAASAVAAVSAAATAQARLEAARGGGGGQRPRVRHDAAPPRYRPHYY